MNSNYFWLVVISFFVGGALGVVIGRNSITMPIKAEAVERGHAEWLVNQKDGTTKWQWKESK